MLEAYLYAEGETPPAEIRLLNQIDRFGALEVLGRPLSAREIIHMRTADNIVRYYQSRAAAKNWATWAKENDEGSRILNYCMGLINESDFD